MDIAVILSFLFFMSIFAGAFGLLLLGLKKGIVGVIIIGLTIMGLVAGRGMRGFERLLLYRQLVLGIQDICSSVSSGLPIL